MLSDKIADADGRGERQAERGAGDSIGKGRDDSGKAAKTPDPPVRDWGKGGVDLGL